MPTRHSRLVEKLRSSSIFTYRLVESSVGSYAKVLLHNLRKRGEIVELVKGVYTFKKSPYMIVKAIPMSYIGLGSAAFLHGAWNQVGAITVLSPAASKTVRSGERIVAGFKVIVRRISEKMYFGYDYIYMEDLGEWVRVSDPEKTLIDLVYFRHPAIDEMSELILMADASKLEAYLELMEERGVRGWRAVRRRVGDFLHLGDTISSRSWGSHRSRPQ